MSDVFTAYLNGAGIFLLLGYIFGTSGAEWYIYPVGILGCGMVVFSHYYERKGQ